MPSTRQQVCDRVLRMLNKTDGDSPASAGDFQVVNELLEPIFGRLARQGLIYTIDIGTPGDLSSGAVPDSLFFALCQVLTLAAASDFGAPTETYKAIADQGEQTLVSLRYRADRISNPTPPAQGTRGDLCQRTLKMLSIIKEGDNPTTEALTVVDNLIIPTVDRLSRQGVVFVATMGTAGNLASGVFDDTTIFALAQVLTKPAASAFGTPYIGGTLDDYAKLADDGEQTLIAMRYKAPRNTIVVPPTAGTRNDLCYRTLKIIGIIREGDVPTDEAVQVVNRLIGPTMHELQRRGIVYVPNLGAAADLTSGNIPDSEVDALTQILSKPTALQFGPPYFTGNMGDYVQLATDGEQRLRRMTAAVPFYTTLKADYS